MTSLTSEVKLIIEYFVLFTILAIFVFFSLTVFNYVINKSSFYFEPDCQYTLKFFKFIFFNNF